jgi:hypothetical protein
MLKLRVTTHVLRCIDKEVAPALSRRLCLLLFSLSFHQLPSSHPPEGKKFLSHEPVNCSPGQRRVCRSVCSVRSGEPSYTFAVCLRQGGLDNYLVNTRNDKLDSELGTRLKEQVFHSPPHILMGLYRVIDTKACHNPASRRLHTLFSCQRRVWLAFTTTIAVHDKILLPCTTRSFASFAFSSPLILFSFPRPILPQIIEQRRRKAAGESPLPPPPMADKSAH